MGSWSEACGFSGMEIGEGEVAYVMLMKQHNGSLNDGAFHHYTPTTTLVRGTYNDYGYLNVEEDESILAIFNQQADLNLKNGDDFSLSHLDGRPNVHRWWIHGSAFDFMPTIVPDFPYASTTDEEGKYKSVKISNIGEAQDVFYQKVAADLQKALEKARALASKSDPEKSEGLADLLFEMSMNRTFGYRTPAFDPARLTKEILAGTDPAPRLAAARRISTLGWAMGELRKALAPCESTGPQHGGAEASVQFANFLIKTQAERGKRWGDE